MNMRVFLAAFVLSSCAAGCGADPAAAGPNIDGGWKGTYECGADSKKLSAIIDEDAQGALSGEMFLDYQVVVLGNPILLTGRAAIQDAAQQDDGSFSGHLDVLDNSQGLSDFDFTLALNKDADGLAGALEIKNQDGEVTQTCDARLDKVSVDD